jgi:hypothetical protein
MVIVSGGGQAGDLFKYALRATAAFMLTYVDGKVERLE